MVMQINTNSSPISVGGIDKAAKTVHTSAVESDSVSFNQIDELAKSLREEGEVRPDQVERAAALIADVQWPPPETIRRIARLLSMDISPNSDPSSPPGSSAK